jgi:hypothetical protein
VNHSTRVNVATVGAVFGLSGMSHGFFEALQGNVPTPGLYVSAIGEAQRMWPHGSEPAFTVIPNFLATGVAAMLVGLALIVWSLGFVHRRHGPAVFLGLFVLLLLACLLAVVLLLPLAFVSRFARDLDAIPSGHG